MLYIRTITCIGTYVCISIYIYMYMCSVCSCVDSMYICMCIQLCVQYAHVYKYRGLGRRRIRPIRSLVYTTEVGG